MSTTPQNPSSNPPPNGSELSSDSENLWEKMCRELNDQLTASGCMVTVAEPFATGKAVFSFPSNSNITKNGATQSSIKNVKDEASPESLEKTKDTSLLSLGQRVRHRHFGGGALRKTKLTPCNPSGLVEWDSHRIARPFRGYDAAYSWVKLSSLAAEIDLHEAEPSSSNPCPKETPTRLDSEASRRGGPVELIVQELAEMHGGFRQHWLNRHDADLPTDDVSTCPFCGWDSQEDWGNGRGCKHFLTSLLCDWYEFCPEGTSGGTLEHVANASLRLLNNAVTSFLRSEKRGICNIDTLEPERLRLLVKSIREGIANQDGDDRDLDADSSAYGQYFMDVCKAARIIVVQTHYDSGDAFGTSPHAFWTEQAVEASRELANAIRADKKALKVNSRRA